MGSQGTQTAPLPTEFTAEVNPKVHDTRLEFIQDINARGVVHRVMLETGVRLMPSAMEDCGQQNVVKITSNTEDLMGPVSVNTSSDPAVRNEQLLKGRSRNNTPKKGLHSRNTVIGASIGAIFVGYMLGTSLGGNEMFGVIGACLVLGMCLAGMYFPIRSDK